MWRIGDHHADPLRLHPENSLHKLEEGSTQAQANLPGKWKALGKEII